MQQSTTDSIVKGTLLAIAMTLIGAGSTMLGAKDLYGLLLMATGFGIIWLREYLKVS
jgi:hypothetical protein